MNLKLHAYFYVQHLSIAMGACSNYYPAGIVSTEPAAELGVVVTIAAIIK